jgi:hypothetical protein
MLTGRIHEFLEMAGVSLAVLCVAGRMWSSLYIGSRKNRELVTTGPYSITRNPLYFFSTLGAVGIGLMFGSIVCAFVLGVVTYGILASTAKKESAYLRAMFGTDYDLYARRTPFFWPRPWLYRDVQEMSFSPKALNRTLIDAILFVLVFPVIEIIEHLQSSEAIPILLRVF